MNGPHDLGGQMGFGPVMPEKNEPVFHADWEKRALGITICCDALGAWTIDESRYSVECIAPVDYLAGNYYQNWIRGLDVLLERHGLASRAELFSGRQERDEQTVDIVTAVFGAALLWGVPLVAVIVLVSRTGAEVAGGVATLGAVAVAALYVGTVVLLLRRWSR